MPSIDCALSDAPPSLIGQELRLRNRTVRERGPAAREDNLMAWKTPTVVEVPVGMEINMYACAKTK